MPMMITRCKCCDKPLALNQTAWSCGPMFCSHYCGIKWAMTKYEAGEYTDESDLRSKATAYFNDIAEEISREDYGARTEYFTTYDGSYDISVVFEQVYEGEELICTSVIGWYFGPQDHKMDEFYRNKLTAMFVD